MFFYLSVRRSVGISRPGAFLPMSASSRRSTPREIQRWRPAPTLRAVAEAANRTHCLKQRGRSPVHDGDAHRDGQAADSSARTCQEGKRRAQKNDNPSDQREGEFLLPLHGKPRRVEPCLLQALYIFSQLPPIHLIRLAHLAAEIAGRLGNLRKRLHFERCVAADLASGEIAYPSAGQRPGVFGLHPGGARGEYSAAYLERLWIELEDAQSAEEVLIGIEKFVILNFRAFAENPLPGWLEIGLRRAAFDLVAQCVLALVGVGKKRIVEQEHSRGDDAAGQRERQNQAVEAHAAGLESDHFVIFSE